MSDSNQALLTDYNKGVVSHSSTWYSMRCFVVLVLLSLLSSKAVVFAFAHPRVQPATSSKLRSNAKDFFLDSLVRLDTLNDGTKERTKLLNSMIEEKIEVDVKKLLGRSMSSSVIWSSANPGSLASILAIGPGTWKVVYAPHMTTIAKLAGNLQLDVQYILYKDQSIESHAKFSNVPFLSTVYLSVGGTYSSVSDTVCSVKWNDAWVKIISQDDEDVPYPQIDDVPESLIKTATTNIGRLLFIQPFSVFPVSFLSPDLTVFDFEFLGTRICARKLIEESS
ncbi:hypothetical protein MHU86_24868 [Fragilaria crotonensis]|nr:hypothetical protein MHU86_24868 [Fragilaria crotonensis]